MFPITTSLWKWYKSQLCWKEFKYPINMGTALGIVYLVILILPRYFAPKQCYTDVYLSIAWYWLILLVPLSGIVFISAMLYVGPFALFPITFVLDLLKASKWKIEVNPNNKVYTFLDKMNGKISPKTSKILDRVVGWVFILLGLAGCAIVIWTIVSQYLCIEW